MKKEINYKLYTDASRRKFNEENLCVIAGYLLGEKNRPIVEFVLEIPYEENTEYLEMLALKTGLELAHDIGVNKITCYVDNLNTVKIIKKLMVGEEILEKEKGWKRKIAKFTNFTIEHIPREYNVYANALAKLPFNIRLKGDINQAYHGINRSKKRFYDRIKNGLENDIHNFQAKTNASVYLKFKSTRDLLEKLCQKTEHTNHDLVKIESLFKKFYTYFHTVLYSRKNVEDNIIKEENPIAFLDFLSTTTINEKYWPTWLNKRTNKFKFKF